MPIEILMPALSPTMTEGNLVAWLKAEGDTISPGEVIAEIETDKATMEVEAVDEGVLGKILVAAGTEGVSVNAAIAILLEEGEDKSSLKDNAYGSDQIELQNTQNSEQKSEGKPDLNEPKTGKVVSENTKMYPSVFYILMQYPWEL